MIAKALPKWTLLLLAVLLDIAAAASVFPYTYVQWPPPHFIPTIGVAPSLLSVSAAVVSLVAFVLFMRTSGIRRLFAILPFLSFGFAALCTWTIWDYPRAYQRFMHDQATRIRAMLDESVREHQKEEEQEQSGK